MDTPTPLATVNQLIAAFHARDVDAACALYEPDGVLVEGPGSVARGPAALRAAVAAIIALQPTLTTDTYDILVVDDVALYCSRWRLSGTAPDGSPVHQSGTSTDILRRSPDGQWRVAIDNPIGDALLG
jgi:uncharacterized protein (TIGR02246 family)